MRPEIMKGGREGLRDAKKIYSRLAEGERESERVVQVSLIIYPRGHPLSYTPGDVMMKRAKKRTVMRVRQIFHKPP